MGGYGPSILPRLIDMAWRRRYLLLVPVLAMIPLSVAAALFLPQGYVAKFVLLLQETAPANPLSRDTVSTPPSPDRMRERLLALRALVGSDYVLGQVVDDIDNTFPKDAKERAAQILALRRAISVDMSGGEVLEFRLAGSQAEGLGHRLEIAVAHLMKALTAQGGTSIGELLIKKREQELEAATREQATIEARFKKLFPDGLQSARQKLGELQQRASAAAGELSAVDKEIGELRALLGNAAGQADRDAAAKVPVAPAGTGDVTEDPAAARLSRLRHLGDFRSHLAEDLRSLKSSIESLSRLIAENQRIEHELTTSEEVVANIRQSYERDKQRFGSAAIAQGPSIFTAPERIKVIDPPTDPSLPVTRRVYVILAGVMAGLVLALCLAILAEVLDRKIRYPEQLVAISGVPIVARLPNMS